MVCVDSGFQISVAGAAGMEVKETEHLATVPGEDEAVQIIAAFVQLYREHARYLDRPYKWVAKVGLDWVRSQIDDLPTRAALVERFEISQSVYRRDPWADLSTPTETPKWAPLADLTLEAAE